MDNIAIRAASIGKQYRIGTKRQVFLGDALANAFISPLSRLRSTLRGEPASISNNTIWALKDISFEIKQGEAIGIIGRNGSGKSTLLKILSRITDPTAGFADIHGRVASLLEVGTGFNLTLTGRENIYLSGAILGMKKAELDRKFDEIVAFSEVEKFIDTPVRHYSSGMYLRLAFAVAAHLEPEILLIDEVLAVGDSGFQKKCLGRMEEVAKKGRTVLFVSHNMAAIQSLCSSAIVLQEGRLVFKGTTEQAITKYLASVEQLSTQPLDAREDRVGGDIFRFTGVQFLNPETMAPCNCLISGQSVIIRIVYECADSHGIGEVGIGIGFHSASGTHLFGCRSKATGVAVNVHPGKGYTDCRISKWPLKAGRYSYHLYAEKNGTPIDHVTEAGCFDVEAGDYYGSGLVPMPSLPGVLIDYTWAQ